MLMESGREWQSARRFPRLFMNLREEPAPLQRVLLALPNRTHVPVLGLSLAGVIISPQGLLGQIKLGQIFDCKLKVAGAAEAIPLRLRVLRLNAQAACLAMESISSNFRLKIDQVVKDQLIFSNLRKLEASGILPALAHGQWWHGPFETNFLMWTLKAEDGTRKAIRKAIVEYDGVIAVWENSMDGASIQLRKSVPASEESNGYSGPWLADDTQKISLGHNWKDRLERLLPAELEEFHPLLQKL